MLGWRVLFTLSDMLFVVVVNVYTVLSGLKVLL